MRLLLTGVTSLLVLLVATGGNLAAQSFVHGFKSDSDLPPGTLVSISSQSSDTVEAALKSSDRPVYGVVVDPADAQVAVAQEGQDVLVATSGLRPVLVSVESGPVKAGDYLAMSSSAGIAARAVPTDEQVIGQAASDFDGSDGELTKTASGSSVGRLTVNIGISKNPLRGDTLVPGPLRSAAETIAGKNLSAVRLYGALTVLLIALLMAVSVLWIGVRGGMIAIGRNPLSRHSIMQSLVVVIGMSVLIFTVGLLGVYLLLKL